MTTEEIISVLRLSKKYSKSNFVYKDYYVIYIVDSDHSYKIEFYSSRGKFVFRADTYAIGVEPMKVSMVSDLLNEKKVLSGFGKVIKGVNKLNALLFKKNEILLSIKPVLALYVKKELNVNNFDINDPKVIGVKFPEHSKRIRNKWRNVPYDVETENPSNLNLKITLFVKEEFLNSQYTLYFNYSLPKNKLTLIRRDESHKSKTKDITRIIRSEKLKKLIFANENSI
jgi:hypothetical protein